MLQILYLPVLLVTILVYFRIADRFNIIDKPNHRSSHSQITLRGGGIIFPIALFLYFLTSNFKYPYFILGMLIIGLVSFIDDIKPLSNKIRIFGHLSGVSILFLQTNLFSVAIWWLLIGYIMVIGTINAYNFMDGINGITGGYSLVLIGTLAVMNHRIAFVDQELIIVALMSLLVFNFFNFRAKAKCFAGDVGSVSIAFIILFLLLMLIQFTEEIKYVGFLLVYGLDAISTIIFRIIRRENIFEAHRAHLYQYLANRLKWPHLQVAIVYMVSQLVVNIVILNVTMNMIEFILFCFSAGILFIGLRFMLEGKDQLLHLRG